MALMFVGSALLTAGPASAGVSDPSEADVVLNHPAGPEDYARFPTAVRTDDGRILVAYRAAAEHIIGQGRIMLVESRDGGRHWSKPRTIVDTTNDDRDPMLMQTRRGTLLLSFFQTDWWREPRRPKVMGTFVARSADGGRHWSDPVKVGTALDGPSDLPSGPYESGGAATHGQIVELPDGDLLVPLYGTRPDEPRNSSSVVRSTDGGRTWPASNESVIADADTLVSYEPVPALLGDGSLVVLLRTSGKAYLSRSDDGGRTWSQPQVTDMTAQSAHLLVRRDGSVLATYGENSGAFGPRRPTVGRLVESPEGSWDGYPEVLLYDAMTTSDQANPSSVAVGKQRFLTFTFNGSTGQIVGVYSKADDYR
jgi:Neuraminidase (sialidase)